MRYIHTHRVDAAPAVDIHPVAVGAGGAPIEYHISGMTANYGGMENCDSTTLFFQNGLIPITGVNGLTNEALIAIVIDRLQEFQKGTYNCRENALALTKLEESMHWLHSRTRVRKLRGVEGKLEK